MTIKFKFSPMDIVTIKGLKNEVGMVEICACEVGDKKKYYVLTTDSHTTRWYQEEYLSGKEGN